MLKSVAAASTHRHMAPVKPAADPESPSASGFGDLLDAAGEANQHASSHRATGGKSAATSRDGAPATGSSPIASTSTLSAGLPAMLPDPATDTETGGLAAHLVGRPKKYDAGESSDTSQSAKSTPDDRPSAPAKTGSAATSAITPDAVAALNGQPSVDMPLVLDSKAVTPTTATQQSPAPPGPDDATANPGVRPALPGAQPAVPPSASSGSIPAGATQISDPTAASGIQATLWSNLLPTPGTRPASFSVASPAGKDGGSAANTQQATGVASPTLSRLVDTIQRNTGIAVDRIAVSPGSASHGSDSQGVSAGSSSDPAGTVPADPPPVADATALAEAVAASPATSTVTNPASTSLLGVEGASSAPRTGHGAEPAQGHDEGGSQVQGSSGLDPLSVNAEAVPAASPNIAETGAANAPQSPAAGAGVPPSVAAQVTPALISMAQGNGVGGRLSISITPDQLGQVHITVERSTDGTTSIHVAAEHLGTLNLLRHDQADLTRALDQAGISQDGHSLSFSWNGGDGAMQGWNAPSDQGSKRPRASVPKSYATEIAVTPSATIVATRGSVDLTA